MCEFVARVLEAGGYHATTAGGGPEAVATVERCGPPDLLLSDFRMPQMNGDALAARLRQYSPDMKVLYLTGYSQALFDNRGTLWEGEAFLEKPCSPSALLQGVSLLLFDQLEPPLPEETQQRDSMRALLGGLAKNPRRDVV